jgi:hypothetical protein
MTGAVPTALVIALVAAAPASAQVPLPVGQEPQQPPPQEPAPPAEQERTQQEPRYERLSDERTLSRWAHAVTRSKVRRRPDGDARSITRLRYDTEDGLPEVYLALRRYVDASGRHWIEVRLPMRPNGRTGWVRREALGELRRVRTFLRIDRRRLRATLYRRGKRIWSAPVGVGKPGTETPAGRFYVRERLRVRDRGSLYGPLAFGTSAYSRLSDWPGGGVVGIHGTNQPELIPGRPSHGCVRVRNRAIKRLGRLLPIGTPIRIR